MTQIMAAGHPSKATPKPRKSGSFTCGHVHFYPGLFSDVRVLERPGGTCIDKYLWQMWSHEGGVVDPALPSAKGPDSSLPLQFRESRI